MQRRPTGVCSLNCSPTQGPSNSSNILHMTYLFLDKVPLLPALGSDWPSGTTRSTDTDWRLSRDRWLADRTALQKVPIRIQGPGSQADFNFFFLILPPLLRTPRTSALFLHDIHPRPAPAHLSTPSEWPFSQQKPHPFETTGKKGSRTYEK